MKLIPLQDYFVMKDCEFQMTGNTPVKMKGNIIMENPDGYYDLDKRLNCVSFENTKSLNSYMRYYQQIAEMIMQMDQHEKNPFLTLLDSGYIPLSIPPTFMAEKVYDMMMGLARTLQLDFIEYPAMTLKGARVDTSFKDIWVSRVQLSAKLNIPVNKISIQTIFERMVKQ